jgi:hypothetical protein
VIGKMLIKMNGAPWENVKVDNNDTLPSIAVDYFDALNQCAGELPTCFLNQLIDTTDRVDYLVMSKTEITEHIYKASCWAVDKVLTAFGGG